MSSRYASVWTMSDVRELLWAVGDESREVCRSCARLLGLEFKPWMSRRDPGCAFFYMFCPVGNFAGFVEVPGKRIPVRCKYTTELTVHGLEPAK